MGALIQSIGAVTGFFTLAAFVVAALVFYHRVRLTEESRRIQALPEADRGEAFDALLGRMGIDAKGLSREQRYQLAEQQLAAAQRRDLYRFSLILVGIAAAGLLWWQSQRTSPALRPPPKLTEAERDSVAYHVDAAQFSENNARPRQAIDHYRAALRFVPGDSTIQGRVAVLQQLVNAGAP